jgi:NAD(P)-dependent dehydrogenase (short-subunit alcohol dehydrogenase family)
MSDNRLTELTIAIRMTCTNPVHSGRPARPSLIVTFDGSEQARRLSRGRSGLRELAERLDFREIPTFPTKVTARQVADTLATSVGATRAYPNVVAVEGYGLFFIGRTRREALRTAEELYTEQAHGVGTDFEEIAGLRLAGSIAVVTGSAQGFGKGIARELVRAGAHVVIADINDELGRQTRDRLIELFDEEVASFQHCNVADPASVEALVDHTVATFGGLDLFVANAGVLKAGGLNEMDPDTFRFVTEVNYSSFFLCARAASRVMKIQHVFNPAHFADIVQINSKSGLEGSNRNFAYAGSKFGAIGLVQSFAMELVVHRIKVNAVCPGNFFEGPLWSDPDRGLFVQYLRAGKVPGATTIDDVRRFYMSKVPMGRGCSPLDVARALFYLYEQEYETGQAIPVTGGQVMLH